MLAAAALHSASAIARHLSLDVEDVLGALADSPFPATALLECPQGWTALGEYCREAFGGHGAAYLPTIH